MNNQVTLFNDVQRIDFEKPVSPNPDTRNEETKQAQAEYDLVKAFFKVRQGHRYCAFEVAQRLSIREGNVRRAMSQLKRHGFLIKLNGGRAHPETRKYNAFYQTA